MEDYFDATRLHVRSFFKGEHVAPMGGTMRHRRFLVNSTRVNKGTMSAARWRRQQEQRSSVVVLSQSDMIDGRCNDGPGMLLGMLYSADVMTGLESH